LTACSTAHYADTYHTQIKEHEAAGNGGGDDCKQFSTVKNNSHDAEYQGSED